MAELSFRFYENKLFSLLTVRLLNLYIFDLYLKKSFHFIALYFNNKNF